MIIRKLKELAILKNPHQVDVRQIYDKDNALINIITLQKGESLKPHITAADVAFYVLQGKGVVQIGEEKQEVEVEDLIESPKNILHCWSNKEEQPLRVLVVKAPKPTKKTIFL